MNWTQRVLPYLIIMLLILLGTGNVLMYRLAWEAQHDTTRTKDLAVWSWDQWQHLDDRIDGLETIQRLRSDVEMLKAQNSRLFADQTQIHKENAEIRAIYLKDLKAELSAKQARTLKATNGTH